MTHEKCGKTAKSTGEPCQRPAGWGTENTDGPCKFHGGASLKGKDSPNYKHGAYSKFLTHDLTPKEVEAFEDLVGQLDDPANALQTVKELAAEALIKYKRSGDSRFLREYRQLADTFNFAPNADELEVSGDGIVIYTESDGDGD